MSNFVESPQTIDVVAEQQRVAAAAAPPTQTDIMGMVQQQNQQAAAAAPPAPPVTPPAEAAVPPSAETPTDPAAEMELLRSRIAEMEAAQSASREQQARQREIDFQRRLEALPAEERLQAELEWERSRRVEYEMSIVRDQTRQQAPLFVGFMDQLAQHVDIEMDPQEFRELASVMQPFIGELVRAGVQQERARLEAEYARTYGQLPGRATAAQGPITNNPGSQAFANFVEAHKGRPYSEDDIRELIRLKRQAGV